jgi:hypothetical protein
MRTRLMGMLAILMSAACAATPEGGRDAAAVVSPKAAVDVPSPTPIDSLTELDGHAWRLDADYGIPAGMCAEKETIIMYYTLTFTPDGTNLHVAGVQLDVFDHFDADLAEVSDLRRTYGPTDGTAVSVQVWLENGVAHAALVTATMCQQGLLTLES